MVSSNSTPAIQEASNLSAIIAKPPYEALLFEVPGTSWKSSEEDPYECVIIDKPTLHQFAGNSPDKDTFAEHFSASLNYIKDNAVCTFAN